MINTWPVVSILFKPTQADRDRAKEVNRLKFKKYL